MLFGQKPGYLKFLREEFGIGGKGVKAALGNLESEYRKKEAGVPTSTEAYERYPQSSWEVDVGQPDSAPSPILLDFLDAIKATPKLKRACGAWYVG